MSDGLTVDENSGSPNIAILLFLVLALMAALLNSSAPYRSTPGINTSWPA